MKKTVSLLAGAIILLLFCSCPPDPAPEATTYSVSINPTGALSGEALTADAAAAEEGDTITLSAELNAGRLVTLNAEGVTISPSNISTDGGAATFTMPAADVTVNAVFSDIPASNYSIIVNPADAQPGEAVTPDLTSSEAGTLITLTASLNSGRQVALSAAGVTLTPASIASDGDTATFTMPAANVTVNALFSDIPATLYDITINPTDAQGGEAVTADVSSAAQGSTITLTAALNSGRRVALSAAGVTLTPASIANDGGTATFSMPAANVTVEVVFSDIPATVYDITINESDAETGESLSADVTSATEGTLITLTAGLNTNRRVSLAASGTVITPSEISADNGTATFSMPGSDITVNASFADILVLESSLAIAFTDNDPDEDEIGGQITIRVPEDESAIDQYNIYWGTNGTTVDTLITSLAKTGANLAYVLPADSSFSATPYFIVRTETGGSENPVGESVEIEDYVHGYTGSGGKSIRTGEQLTGTQLFTRNIEGAPGAYTLDASTTVIVLAFIDVAYVSASEWIDRLQDIKTEFGSSCEAEVVCVLFRVGGTPSDTQVDDVLDGATSTPTFIVVRDIAWASSAAQLYRNGINDTPDNLFIYIISKKNQVSDKFHYDSPNNIDGTMATGISANDAISFDWDNITDPGGGSDARLNKMRDFIIRRVEDLLDPAPQVTLDPQPVTVYDGLSAITLTFNRKAYFAWDPDNYSLTNGVTISSISPAGVIALSDYYTDGEVRTIYLDGPATPVITSLSAGKTLFTGPIVDYLIKDYRYMPFAGFEFADYGILP
ncbi:MAG: hypothetical protein JW874_07315 [Spirochaetales bacterium]|nr:hypothetical protein [Spirochaetales bacterium]